MGRRKEAHRRGRLDHGSTRSRASGTGRTGSAAPSRPGALSGEALIEFSSTRSAARVASTSLYAMLSIPRKVVAVSKLRVLLIGVVVTFASFVPAASAAAGLA